MIFKNKRGFALITVFIMSTILAGVIGFTFISASRSINLKSILHLSKTSLTTADAGLEEMIREIQSYHFDNIATYLSKLYVKGLDSTPVLYTYYPDFFKDPRDGDYILTRAKYFMDFDYYRYDDEGNPIPVEIVNWDDVNEDNLVNETEGADINENGIVDLLTKVKTEPNEVAVNPDLLEYIQSLQRGQDEAQINAICSDIQNAYNQWMSYLWGLNWGEGFKTTDTGENLGAMEQMISKLGGNDLDSGCTGIEINDIIKPYDVDNPTDSKTYEGLIVQTAGKIDTSSTSTQRGLIIITAIGYSFSSPIPKDDYEDIIEPRLSLVCPRPNDPEYEDHYVNILDIDAINNSLKLAGSKYRITPMKRGIRGEFEVKYESSLDSVVQPLLNKKDTVTYVDEVSFSDYLIAYRNASGNSFGWGYDEELHGPMRCNGPIYLSGEIWDTIISSSYIYDYLTFGPYANQHTGGFHFYFNGIEYKVEPFKNSSQSNPSSTTANIYPPFIYNGVTYNQVNILKKPDTNEYYIDLPYNNSEPPVYYDIKVYSQQQPEMDFSKVQTSGVEIMSKAQSSGYYFDGSNKAVELHFLENGTIQVKEGNGPTRILDMPTNYPVTISDANGTVVYPGGVIYVEGDVTVRGKVNGRVTVYASDDIWIESDLTYVDSPIINPSQTPNSIPDALGLIAYDDVFIHKNAPEHLRIDAAILAQTGSFGIDPNAQYHKYNANRILDFRGSQTFYSTDNAPAIYDSFSDKYKGYETQLTYYDYNLKRARPPLFPSLGDETTTRIAITNTYDAKNLVGPLKSTFFGRILWREMVSPP